MATQVVTSPLDAAPVYTPEAEPERWSLALRAAFRFSFVYIALYYIEWLVQSLPGTSALDTALNKFWWAILPWIGKNILRINYPIPVGPNGSGDTTADYVQLVVFVAMAAAGALVWSVIDRRRPNYKKLYGWLHLYGRYMLAVIMFSYGFAKVIKLQFPFLSLWQLLEPYGDASPMGLLWTFMGYSTPYTFFAGASEVLGGALLLFRRTATMGALVSAAVITNIVMMNFSYDVPVKLFASNILLLAIFLASPDMRRIADFFVFHRPVTPAPIEPLVRRRWMRIGSLALKVLFIGWTLFANIQSAVKQQYQYGTKAPKPRIYGIYEVESFTRGGQEVPPLVTDATRWRKAVFMVETVLLVKAMNDSGLRYKMELAKDKPTLTLTETRPRGAPPPPPNAAPPPKSEFSYTRTDPDHLMLEGSMGGAPVVIKMKRIDESKFLLVNRGFHWINEFPYNR